MDPSKRNKDPNWQAALAFKALSNGKTKPILGRKNSQIFCAPNCGHKCTKREHDEAVTIAKALAKQAGIGWGWRVWENVGWHPEAFLYDTDPDELTLTRFGVRQFAAFGFKGQCIEGASVGAVLRKLTRMIEGDLADLKDLRALLHMGSNLPQGVVRGIFRAKRKP